MKGFKMKMLTTTLMSVLLSFMAFCQDYEQIPLNEIQAIAQRNAEALWGDVYPATPIPYYGFDDEIVAWRFNYSIGKPFPKKSALAKECAVHANTGDRFMQWGGDDYGRMLIGARTDMPVMLEYARCLSAEYAEMQKISLLADGAFPAEEIEFGKIYYLNHFDTWREVSGTEESGFVCAAPTGGVLTKEAFDAKKLNSVPFVKTGNFAQLWQKYLNGFTVGAKADKYIPDHIYMPFYDWSYGCSPTAAAMLFAWYDYRSAVTDYKYPYFVVWHNQRWDGPENEQDYNVPNLQRDLAIAMDTDTLTGSTASGDLDEGMEYVANDQRGYNFDVEEYYTFLWTRTKNDIDDGKPNIVSIPGHSTTGVGYNDNTDMAITHYTHDPPSHIVWVSRWSIDMVVRASKGGQKGSHVKLRIPHGDPRYNENGNGEVYFENNWAEINWESDIVEDSWVDLLYSTNGGHAFQPIAMDVPNTGAYNWQIPGGTASTNCRVMINLHDPDMEPYIAGADGSWGNFIINAGGGIGNMVDGQIYETEQVSKFFHLQHTDPSWAVVGSHTDTIGCHWQIQIFDGIDFNNDPEHSYAHGRKTNFIVVDGNHETIDVKGVKHRPYGCKGLNKIQYEGGNDDLVLTPGGTMQINWPANQMVKMYDIHLTPGQYYFRLNRGFGDMNIDMAFFNSSDGDYIKDISQAAYISQNWGGAVDEFIAEVTVEDDYGLCLFATEMGAGSVGLKIDDAYIWTGDEDSNWHNGDNWLGGTVPGWTSNVAIPNTANDPNVYIGEAHCNNLNILQGGKITLTNYGLVINGNLNLDGEIETTISAQTTYCYGNVTVSDNGRLDLNGNAAIWVGKDWTFEEAAVNPIDEGTVKFFGTENSVIHIKSEHASFQTLRISKTGDAWVAYDNCPGLEPLIVKGQFILDDGAKFIQWALYNTIFEGPFLVYGSGSYAFVNGTAIFDYAGVGGIVVSGNTESYFNHLVISCADWLQLASDIEIRGDLTINEGNFKTMGYDVYIKGDWNDEAWGFNHGSSRVIFNGTGTQTSYGGAFWELELNKPSGELRIRQYTTGIQHYDWTQGAIRVNGGYFYVADLVDDGLYGDIIITEGNIEVHQDPGQFLDMNANLEISDGEMELHGGNGIGYWPFSADASITMTGGLINVHDHGIRIYNSATYDLVENITGGTIMINGDLRINRDDFHPEGGTIMMYGYEEDAILSSVEAASLFNFVLDKSSKDKAIAANLVASGVVDINGDFTIDGGNFEAPEIMKIQGQLINNVNPDNFDAMDGTLIFDGPDDNYIEEDETFYNLTIEKPTGYFIVNEGISIDIENTLTVEEGLMGLLAGCDLSLGEALAVNSGGTIVFEGDDLDKINVNSSVGKANYAFDINPGGTIGAINTVFIFMDADGLNMHSGSYIMPEGAFHNCNFAYGLPGGTLLTIDNGADIVIQDAYFLTNTTGMAHNVNKNVDNGSVYFDEAIGDFSGPDFENDPFNRIHWEYIPPFEMPFTETWDSEDFETNIWTPTGSNWVIDDLYGNDAPSAAFRYTPVITNYSQALRSYRFNGQPLEGIMLSFDITYDEYQPGTLEQLSVRVVYPNGDFYTVANYTNASGSFGFLSEQIDISDYTAGEIFQISFVAHGENSWNINKWNVDNINLEEIIPVPGAVKGNISGAEAKVNIEGAHVSLLNTNFETFTNEEGYYILEDIPPGDYTMKVKADGYYSDTKNITIEADITLIMNFELNPLPPDYCTDDLYNTGCTEGDGINTFILEDIENENSGCSSGGYGDFTGMSTALSIGGLYPLKVSSNFSNQYVSVWIDIQDDFHFSPVELFVVDFFLIVPGELYEIPLEIPDTLGPGEHRLRIRTNWNASSADPCAQYNYGEAEDYTINLVDGDVLSGLKIFVSNEISKAPVEGAYIELMGTNWSGFTQEEGYCYLNDVDPGIYDVLVLAEGYEDMILPGQNLYANQTLNVECVLSPAIPETQTIYLKNGWQGLSSYLMPMNDNIQDIFAPVANYLEIVHNDELVYWPGGQVFTLTNWGHHDAFVAKMNGSTALDITGFAESDLSFQLEAGWSMLPVLCRNDILVDDLLVGTTAADNLVMIKEIAGTGIYWPEFGIYSLEALEAGNAYRICMDIEDVIVFPESPYKYAGGGTTFEYPKTKKWNTPQESAISHVIAFGDNCFSEVPAPDELWIAAFTPEHICCGMAQLSDYNAITVFGDDPTTFEKDGFAAGEEMQFALINPLTMEEQYLDVTYDPFQPQTDGQFTLNGISLVKLVEMNASRITNRQVHGVAFYPNPTQGQLFIDGLNELGQVKVIGSGGRIRIKKVIESNKTILDLSMLEKGVYIVKIQSANSTITKRIIRL